MLLFVDNPLDPESFDPVKHQHMWPRLLEKDTGDDDGDDTSEDFNSAFKLGEVYPSFLFGKYLTFPRMY